MAFLVSALIAALPSVRPVRYIVAWFWTLPAAYCQQRLCSALPLVIGSVSFEGPRY